MAHVSACALWSRWLSAALFLLLFVGALHAEPATVWHYKGSVVALSQSGSDVLITYQTVSDPLAKSGGHVGDPLFRGERTGNALHGMVYRFFLPQCKPIPFVVDGTIEGDQIILRGISPGLGFDSCKIETTYYDTLQLTAVAAPGETQQATLSPADTRAFNDNISRCRTGDTGACKAALASPLLTDERRAEIEAAAALPAAAASPVYLLYPFRCAFENGKPVLKHSTEPYHHEALDYRPPSSYAVCSPEKGGWVQSLFTTCYVIELASLRLICKDGIATAPQLTPLGKSTIARTSRIEGDSVHFPFYSRSREADVPEGFHRLPAGWGMIPPPQAVTAAKNLEPFFGPKHIPVSGSAAQALPQSFFLTLADWAPLPRIMLLAVFLTAVTFAAFGFSFYPDSRLSPRRPVFWVWFVIAVAGISSALSAGHAITDAFDQARWEATAIEQDQARLDSLFAKRDGHIEPFQHHDLDLARDLQKPRTIIDAAEVAASVPSRAFFFLLPGALFLLVYARFIYAGYHFFFSRHPIEAAGGEALRAGALFDLQKVREAFKKNPEHLFNPPPLHATMNRTRRGKAFREQAELDRDLAHIMLERDRARAALAEAQQKLQKKRKQLPWWRRWW